MDPSAFAAVYDAYAPVVYGLAVRVARSPVLAEEVVQEAFLMLWTGRARYTASLGTVKAYLLGIVHHKAVEPVRRESALVRREQQFGAVPQRRAGTR